MIWLTANTTLWHSTHNASPLSFGERRMVFVAAPLAPLTWAGIKKFGVETLDTAAEIIQPIRGAINIVLLPVTLPTKALIWGSEKIYNNVIQPAGNGALVVSGSIVEGASGVKDAVVNPTKELVKAPFVDIKMNLWDLPLYLFKKVFTKLPMDVLKSPLRLIGGIWEGITDAPKNIKKLASNTRKNVAGALGALGKFDLKGAIEAKKQWFKDTMKDAIIDPVRSLLKPITNPMMPILATPYGAGEIIFDSKIQYGEQMKKAFREFYKGIKRIANAPGHRLNYKPLMDLVKAKEKKVVPPTGGVTPTVTKPKTSGGAPKDKTLETGSEGAPTGPESN